MDGLGLLGRGGLAGADGPDGLIGNDGALHFIGGQADETFFHLLSDDGFGRAGFAVSQSFADADDRLEADGEGFFEFLVDGLVRFAEILAAFRVTDDDVFSAGFHEHFAAHFAGIGAGSFPIHILGADFDVRAFQNVGHGFDRGEDGANDYFDVLNASDFFFDLAGKGNGFGNGLVHFPVAGNNGCSHFSLLFEFGFGQAVNGLAFFVTILFSEQVDALKTFEDVAFLGDAAASETGMPGHKINSFSLFYC